MISRWPVVELMSCAGDVCSVALIELMPEDISICCSIGTLHTGVIVMRSRWRLYSPGLQVDFYGPLVDQIKIIVLFRHFEKLRYTNPCCVALVRLPKL